MYFYIGQLTTPKYFAVLDSKSSVKEYKTKQIQAVTAKV